MYRSALRASTRRIAAATSTAQKSTTISAQGASAGRRFASTTTTASSKRGWKNSALRWGLAAGAVYYYNTSTAFADEPPASKTVDPPAHFSDDDLPTVEAVVAQKRREAEARIQKADAGKPATSAAAPTEAKTTTSDAEANSAGADASAQPMQSPEELEQEAGQQGAFNPETGEINWDCPCLGGMADGPCGEQFKAAFSCFVYSTEEPKGMDCIEKFQGMQDCFRQYPEIYGEELKDDDETEGAHQATDAEAAASASAEKENPPTDATRANTPPSSKSEPDRTNDATDANLDFKPAARTAEGSIDREESAVEANKSS